MMALNTQRFTFWFVLLMLVIGFINLISDTVLPFFISFALAYLLEPIIMNLYTKYKIPKTFAIYIVFFVFLTILLIFLFLGLPSLYNQISLLITKIPTYRNYLQTELVPIIIEKFDHIDPSIANKINDSIRNIINDSMNMLMKTVNSLWSYTIATFNFVAIILFVPIILLYLLRDWSRMIEQIENLLPLAGKDTIKKLLHDINKLLSVYIRGQLNVCGLLMIFYSIGLYLIGLDSALLLGVLSGVLIIIPIVGAVVSVFLSMIVGYFTFGCTIKIAYIVALYLAGHIIEGYIITPKIIGDKIGLHPLWIMFAVLVSGKLLGLIGIFFAIPICGIIKILLCWGIEVYKSSSIYKI